MKTLLVVEDHDMFAAVMLVVLQNCGYTVRMVTGLGVARACMAVDKYDTLVLDLNSSDSSAEETIAALPELVAQIPVVATCHLDDKRLIDAILKTGAKYANKESTKGPIYQVLNALKS